MEGMFTINDKSMNMQRIDETVRLGDTEIWAR
jgi:FtsP/CotA-like multicopper oxidase with cupredoxin domain